MSTNPAQLPDTPSTTPAWLVRLVSLLIAAAGPVIVGLDPGGKITTTDAQAVIILVFLGVAALIFVVHLIVESIKEYGLKRAALVNIEQGAVGEAKELLPELKSAADTAAPVLNQLPGIAKMEGRLTQAENAVSDVKAKVAALPSADKTAAESELSELLGGKELVTTSGTVQIPAKAAPATPAPAVDPTQAVPATQPAQA